MATTFAEFQELIARAARENDIKPTSEVFVDVYHCICFEVADNILVKIDPSETPAKKLFVVKD